MADEITLPAVGSSISTVVQPNSQHRKQAGFYSITFREEDGLHTAQANYLGGWNDERAAAWARHKFGDRLVSIVRSSEEEHAAIVAKNLADNPSRTPLDEKTGGEMNRVIGSPELAAKED